MSDEQSKDMATVLYESFGLVLNKFFDSYGQLYNQAQIAEAVSNAILLINQAHLAYVCELGSEVEEELKDETYKALKDFLDWQSDANIEILDSYFFTPNLKVITDDNEDP